MSRPAVPATMDPAVGRVDPNDLGRATGPTAQGVDLALALRDSAMMHEAADNDDVTMTIADGNQIRDALEIDSDVTAGRTTALSVEELTAQTSVAVSGAMIGAKMIAGVGRANAVNGIVIGAKMIGHRGKGAAEGDRSVTIALRDRHALSALTAPTAAVIFNSVGATMMVVLEMTAGAAARVEMIVDRSGSIAGLNARTVARSSPIHRCLKASSWT